MLLVVCLSWETMSSLWRDPYRVGCQICVTARRSHLASCYRCWELVIVMVGWWRDSGMYVIIQAIERVGSLPPCIYYYYM